MSFCPFQPQQSLIDANDVHETMRTTAPVHRVVDPYGLDAYIVTGYDNVASLLTDTRIVNKRPGGPSGSPGLPLPPALATNLLNTHPADHKRLRALAAPAFSRRNRSKMQAAVSRHVDDVLSRLPSTADRNGHVDLIRDVTTPIPVRVIAELLGVHGSEDRSRFFEAATTLTQQSAGPSAEGDRLRAESVRTILAVLYKLIDSKRTAPDDGLISEWVHAQQGSVDISDDELVSLAFLTFVAGFENSVYQIANALVTLTQLDRYSVLNEVQTPDLWNRRVSWLVDVSLPLSLSIRRFATEDIVVGDHHIPAETPIYLSIRSATNDPARNGRATLAFGRGAHYCLGAELATMQLDLTCQKLLTRWPETALVRPVEELPHRDTWRNHGPTTLPAALYQPTRTANS